MAQPSGKITYKKVPEKAVPGEVLDIVVRFRNDAAEALTYRVRVDATGKTSGRIYFFEVYTFTKLIQPGQEGEWDLGKLFPTLLRMPNEAINLTLAVVYQDMWHPDVRITVARQTHVIEVGEAKKPVIPLLLPALLVGGGLLLLLLTVAAKDKR